MLPSPVLLLGGAGFLGRNLVRGLLRQDSEVVVLSRRASPFEPHPRLHYVQGDLADAGLRGELIQHCGSILFLASESVPGSTARRPLSEIDGNLRPLAAWVETLLDQPPRRILHLSSGGAVYGDPVQLPVAEDAPLQPLSFHAAIKLAAEQCWQVVAKSTRHEVTVLRPSNIYGPGQPLLAHFGVVRKLLEVALRRQELEIWGDGETVRDYLYIEDFVCAGLQLLQRPLQAGFRVFNLGSGVGVSLLELCRRVEAVCGHAVLRRHVPARAVDVRQIVLDSTALTAATGWRPRVDLDTGLRLSWDWLQG